MIEHLELVLGDGLTALTGETGAGKTMLVDAIELLVGGRADTTMVRHGAAEARVDGRFVAADGTETILSRVIPAEGRSRAYVNGRLATVALLAESAADAVDLHGQHAHQNLLSVATQRAALDEFGNVDLTAAAGGPGSPGRDRCVAGDAGRRRARPSARSTCCDIRSSELDAADLVDVDEDARLDAEESVLADAVAHRDAGTAAHALLADDDGARDALGRALAAIEARRPYASQAARIHELLAEVDDLVSEIRDIADGIDESPDRLAELRERRQALKDLQRKYGDDLAAVMAFHADAEDRLRELESFEQARPQRSDDERQAVLLDERRAAAAVGGAPPCRRPQVGAAVQRRLRMLAMPGAAIAVEVGEHDDDHPGDRVQFLLAANPGSPMLPLTRVASGGELARAMLALRLVLSAASDTRATTRWFSTKSTPVSAARRPRRSARRSPRSVVTTRCWW